MTPVLRLALDARVTRHSISRSTLLPRGSGRTGRHNSAALKEEEEAKAAALAEAVAAAEKTMAAEAFARRQAGEARENATAAGQWLVTLGLEREELKGQLAVAETNRWGEGRG